MIALAFAVLFFCTGSAAIVIAVCYAGDLKAAVKRERAAIEQAEIWQARCREFESQLLAQRIRRNLGLRGDGSSLDRDLVHAFNAFEALATERKH